MCYFLYKSVSRSTKKLRPETERSIKMRRIIYLKYKWLQHLHKAEL